MSDMQMGSKAILWQHRYLAALVLTYALVTVVLWRLFGLDVESDKVSVMVVHILSKVPQIIVFVLFWRLFQHTYIARAPDRLVAIKADVRGFLADRDRLVGGAAASALMVLVIICFAKAKTLIPLVEPFSWDVQLMELDRLLHFGVDPYIFLHGVLGWNLSLTFFTGMYNVWLIVIYVALFSICFLRPASAVRMQFLISFLLVWALGGNLLAIIFSSAGPTYYALLGHGDTYRPLMDMLDAHAATGGLTVVDTQRLLWDFYSRPDTFNLISAFPSMHVASSALVAIFAFRLSHWAAYVLTGFAIIILIGSVLLGWHYAVDSYAGVLIAFLIWKGVGWFLRPSSGRLVPSGDADRASARRAMSISTL
ncbi:MAG: phosphoesterase PA-phosphatase [Rhodobacterales bacterium]|nr:MAG: phosphoesterase PA-phosphatase [Rhodobacterales bacterium]